jgi:hypothetical protein
VQASSLCSLCGSDFQSRVRCRPSVCGSHASVASVGQSFAEAMQASPSIPANVTASEGTLAPAPQVHTRDSR